MKINHYGNKEKKHTVLVVCPILGGFLLASTPTAAACCNDKEKNFKRKRPAGSASQLLEKAKSPPPKFPLYLKGMQRVEN